MNSGLKQNFETKRLEKTKIDQLVDELATQLVSLRDEVAANRLKNLASATTNSFSALKAYLEGESFIRAEKYVMAIRALQRAVEDDTTFALAYYRMNYAQSYSIESIIDRKFIIQKALRYSEKLPWRDINLLKAKFYYDTGQAKAAERLYRQIINSYPDDAEAWLQLGGLLVNYGGLQGRSMEDARFALEKSLALNPNQPIAMGFLFGTFKQEGRFADAIPIYEQRIKLAPEGGFALWDRTVLAHLKEDTRLQAQMIEKLEDESSFLIWMVATFLAKPEKFTGVRDVLKLLSEPNRSLYWQARRYLGLAYIDFAQGKIKESIAEINKARDLNPSFPMVITPIMQVTPMTELSSAELENRIREAGLLNVSGDKEKIAKLFVLGLFNAQSGDKTKASAFADSLKNFSAILAKHGRDSSLIAMSQDRAHTILAKISFDQDDLTGAWEELEQMDYEKWWRASPGTDAFTSLAYERYLRAQVLKSLGRHEEAIRWLSTLGNVGWSDITYKAPKHFLLAEIYEELEQPEKAVEHYNYFIKLWQKCDPELQPKVEEAKMRIERLKE